MVQCYLSDKTQFVEIAHVAESTQIRYMSSLRRKLSGIPQSSILEHLLFLLYMT
jgi:hypothetical protein